MNRLVDAMVVLLARLHLIGFLWGDVSLSNTLFRRDAGAFAAYLVDAETGELHDQLTNGQREHDLEIARTNLFGEFSDLEAGGLLDEALDPLVLVESIENRYRELWAELTGVEEFDARRDASDREPRPPAQRPRASTSPSWTSPPTSPGRPSGSSPRSSTPDITQRRLIRLTGLDTEENQARRLLNDLDYYRARTDQQGADEAIVAHEWLTDGSSRSCQSVPTDLRGKLEPAELYHEVLEHRWFLSEQTRARRCRSRTRGQSYMHNVLRRAARRGGGAGQR